MSISASSLEVSAGSIVRTQSGSVGQVVKSVVINGAQFWRVQLYAQMPWGPELTSTRRFIAHSEISAVRATVPAVAQAA